MRSRLLLLVISLVFAGLTGYLGYFVQRIDFQSFIGAYALLFAAYSWVVFYQFPRFSTQEWRVLLGLGIGLRVLLLFSIPALSDDYARFLWDGHLTLAGIHPFAYPPDYFIAHPPWPAGIDADLFARLNSPHYFTVYPPLCQAVFAAAVWMAPHSEWGAVMGMKAFLLLCELGTMRLLWLLTKPADNSRSVPFSVLAYALNPLILLEIMGNAHFEGAMIFFLLLGIHAIRQGRVVRGALWWTMAIASKMLPLLLAPLVWRWLGWRKGLIFIAYLGLFCLLAFAPILPVLPHILESIDLYFRQFQFNASVYYLVREIGFAKIGWDIGEFSGPILGGLTVLGILVITVFTQSSNEHPGKWKCSLVSAMLFAFMLYLSLAATVQPWYAAVPIVLSLLTPWRFPLLWSGLIMLSYSHYTGGGRQEHYLLIALEYLLLWAFFLWEYLQINVRKAPINSA